MHDSGLWVVYQTFVSDDLAVLVEHGTRLCRLPVDGAADTREYYVMIIERFKRLPRRSDDEWQGGLVRLPSWIERGPGGRPYRPWAGV